MEIRWNESRRTPWEGAAAAAPWQQHWAYGAACAALGSKVLRAEISDGSRPLALAQFVCRSFLGVAHAAVCTRGPVWLDATDAAARAEAYGLLRRTIPLPRLRGVFLTPEAGAPERPALSQARLAEVMTPYSTAILDLTADPATLRAAQKGKWRNRLVQAEAAGLRVTRTRGAPDWLLAEETAQQRARRYAALPPALVPAWAEVGGRDSVLTLTAHQGAQPVAAMLFLVHGTGATYHIGWSNEAGRALSAHNLTLWRGIKALRRQGVTRLDLGGLNTADTPGIARFKLGSGATLTTLCGTWM